MLLICLCSNCGWSTDKLASVHGESDSGSVRHWCPNCKEWTGRGNVPSEQEWHELEEKYEVIKLTSSYGYHSDCTECYPEET